MDRAPRELAVPDLSTARAAHSPGFAYRKRRKIVVQEECLLVCALQGINPLLVLSGTESRDHQGLCFATSEQSRTMRARQDAHFGNDRANASRRTVDASAVVEYSSAQCAPNGLEASWQPAAWDRVALCPSGRNVQHLGLGRV